MPTNIQIKLGRLTLAAELNDSSSAAEIVEALPIRAKVNRWGEEFYFRIPVNLDEADDAREITEVGELAYWPPGSAFCIFFGPTPASTDERPRAASAVNPIGKILGDVSSLTNVAGGAEVIIEMA